MKEGEVPRAQTDAEAAPPEGVVIRPARRGDVRAFLALYRTVVAERRFIRTEAIGHRPKYYRRLFRRSWTGDHVRLVAVAEGRIVGSLSVERLPNPVNRHVAGLGMMVEPSWRRKGVGTALMAAALRWAREVGVEKLTLEVYPHNEAAIALYRRFGFVEEGRLARHSKKTYGYQDEVVMSRWLGEG